MLLIYHDKKAIIVRKKKLIETPKEAAKNGQWYIK